MGKRRGTDGRSIGTIKLKANARLVFYWTIFDNRFFYNGFKVLSFLVLSNICKMDAPWLVPTRPPFSVRFLA